LESAQNAAKASGEGAARQLKPGYCPQTAATACGKGAATPEASACPAIAWVLLGRAPPAIVWGRRISTGWCPPSRSLLVYNPIETSF